MAIELEFNLQERAALMRVINGEKRWEVGLNPSEIYQLSEVFYSSREYV